MTFRFNPPLAPSDETRIVHSEENINEAKVKQSKKLIDKVISYIVAINYLFDMTLSEILENSGVTEEQYNNAVECVGKQVCRVHKQKPCEVNIGPYNTVILKLLKSNRRYNLLQVCMQCLFTQHHNNVSQNIL